MRDDLKQILARAALAGPEPSAEALEAAIEYTSLELGYTRAEFIDNLVDPESDQDASAAVVRLATAMQAFCTRAREADAAAVGPKRSVFDSPVYLRMHEAYNLCRQTLGHLSDTLHFLDLNDEHADNCPGCAASKALSDAQDIEAPPRDSAAQPRGGEA